MPPNDGDEWQDADRTDGGAHLEKQRSQGRKRRAVSFQHANNQPGISDQQPQASPVQIGASYEHLDDSVSRGRRGTVPVFADSPIPEIFDRISPGASGSRTGLRVPTRNTSSKRRSPASLKGHESAGVVTDSPDLPWELRSSSTRSRRASARSSRTLPSSGPASGRETSTGGSNRRVSFWEQGVDGGAATEIHVTGEEDLAGCHPDLRPSVEGAQEVPSEVVAGDAMEVEDNNGGGAGSGGGESEASARSWSSLRFFQRASQQLLRHASRRQSEPNASVGARNSMVMLASDRNSGNELSTPGTSAPPMQIVMPRSGFASPAAAAAAAAAIDGSLAARTPIARYSASGWCNLLTAPVRYMVNVVWPPAGYGGGGFGGGGVSRVEPGTDIDLSEFVDDDDEGSRLGVIVEGQDPTQMMSVSGGVTDRESEGVRTATSRKQSMRPRDSAIVHWKRIARRSSRLEAAMGR